MVLVHASTYVPLKDVMTPLTKLLERYGTQDWKPAKNKSAIDSKTEIFIEAINLLWNLCEASNTAMKIFSEQNLLQLLFQHVSVDVFGYRVVTSVLQCLYTVSEDCDESILSKFSEFEQTIASMKSDLADAPERLHLKLLSQGIYLNLVESKGEAAESVLPEVVETVASVLAQDQRKLVMLIPKY